MIESEHEDSATWLLCRMRVWFARIANTECHLCVVPSSAQHSHCPRRGRRQRSVLHHARSPALSHELSLLPSCSLSHVTQCRLGLPLLTHHRVGRVRVRPTTVPIGLMIILLMGTVGSTMSTTEREAMDTTVTTDAAGAGAQELTMVRVLLSHYVSPLTYLRRESKTSEVPFAVRERPV